MWTDRGVGRVLAYAAGVGLLMGLVGCRGASQPASESPPPIPRNSGSGGGRSGALEFWHTRTQHDAEVLNHIVDEFNTKHPRATIKSLYQGTYPQLFQKVTASIQTKQYPQLAVAYESMIVEYMAANIVVPLDPLVSDKEAGLSKASLADIFPQYLAANRFKKYNNQLLSFPFMKSNLVMYYNKDQLKQAGITKAPETWEEFLSQCRTVSGKTGKPCWGFGVDPSTLDGMIFSYGGEVLSPDQKRTLFDQPPTVKVLQMVARAIEDKLAYQVEDADQLNAFASGSATFILRSSNARAFLDRSVGKKFDWDLGIIPHAAGVKPVTVMYGPNICTFKSDPERERGAWEFVKYFTSTEVTARWATETGYLPVRKSAAETATLKQFFAQHPRNRRAFDMLPLAKPEPNVAGWQDVRTLLGDAVTAVITKTQSAEGAARTLKEKADKAIRP